MPRRRDGGARWAAPALALALAATGCVGGPGQLKPGAAASRKPIAVTGGKASPTPRPAAAALAAEAALPAGVATRIIDQAGPATRLTGKVKLISDRGAGLISNNGGAIIANNGGTIIANNGGTIIANNGSAYRVGDESAFRLAQAAPAEATLVDATVFVADAAGRALVGQDGRPLAAVSDGQGGYAIQAALPAENLVMKVRLWSGGELSAILPKADAKDREVAIDTAATLGASYVLSQFVKGDQATFDKLPATEVERLRRDLEAARGLIGRAPDYTPEGLVAITNDLRAKAPTVDQTLADIKALLLGQANLGGGLQAVDVPLADPRTVVRMPDGALLIGEGLVGRVRRVGADGKVSTWIDAIQGEKVKANWYDLNDLRLGPGGAVYGVDAGAARVRRLAADGTTDVVAGSGDDARGPLGASAAASAMKPWALDVGPDGTLTIGENPRPGEAPRVLVVAPGGAIRALPDGPAAWRGRGITGVTTGADGTAWALVRDPGELWQLPAGAAAWAMVAKDLVVSKEGHLRLGPDGLPVVSENDGGRVVRVAADGTKAILAGRGGPPGTADLTSPAGLLFEPGGRLLIADYGANAIWALGPDGVLTRLAGQGKTTQVAADGSIAVNAPGGVAFDARKRMLVSDGGSHTLRRFDGRALETIVGGAMGFEGDGGPAAAARLDGPTGVEVAGETIWLLDSGNHRVRKVAPDFTITTAAGGDVAGPPLAAGKPVAPGAYRMGRGMDIAIGPDGLPAWTDVYANQIHRLRADGQVELLAGLGGEGGFGGDGGAPALATLDVPLGLAYGPDGALYVADAANMRIRRIAPDGASIETFCGQDQLQTFMGAGDAAGPTDRKAAFLVLPGGLCVDAAGNVYVGELGTTSLPLLARITKGFGDLPIDQLPPVPARIRKIAVDGTVTTIAGPGGKFFTDPAAADGLQLPSGLAIDPDGRLVVMDAGANLIRFLPAGSY